LRFADDKHDSLQTEAALPVDKPGMYGGDCCYIGALRGSKSQIEGLKPKKEDANLRLILLLCRENCSFTRY
jgi:hypothetical protein